MADTFTVSLPNGWQAEVHNRGEFAMGCDGFGIVFSDGAAAFIRHFADQNVFVNVLEAKHVRDRLDFSRDGRYCHMSDDFSGEWIVDFVDRTFAPLKYVLRYRHGDIHLPIDDAPRFEDAIARIEVAVGGYDLRFPFCSDATFPDMWQRYLEKRRRELDLEYSTKPKPIRRIGE